MKKSLNFNVPFVGFTSTDIYSCLASVYVHLEKLAGSDDYDCEQKRGQPCNGCGNCADSTEKVLEKVYFLFDTMSGRSSLRNRYDGAKTEIDTAIDDGGGSDDTVEFLLGFAGYEYHKITLPSEFKEAIVASIDAEKPVIAKVKDGRARFRVITGYDGNAIIEADYAGAQRKPQPTSYDEIDALYVLCAKVKPLYTLIDGLKRIRRVMEYNIAEKLWDSYTAKIGWYDNGGLADTDLDEKKARMKRISDTMWYTFNCHNFAEVFRYCYYEELTDPAVRDLWYPIGPTYGYTHDLAWALIDIENQIDWTKLMYTPGMGEMVQLTLYKIREHDAKVLEIIKGAIDILEPK